MSDKSTKYPILIAVTGASGILYVETLLEQLDKLDKEVHLIVSENAKKVMKFEKVDLTAFSNIKYIFDPKKIEAPPASGSTKYSAMVIIPCSMNSLAAMASGITFNLIHRAADCFLKQKRTLIICPRESPLSTIHLKNMLELSKAGAVIFPLMPAFYQEPKDIRELLYNLTARIIDLLGFDVQDVKDWQDIYRKKEGYEGA